VPERQPGVVGRRAGGRPYSSCFRPLSPAASGFAVARANCAVCCKRQARFLRNRWPRAADRGRRTHALGVSAGTTRAGRQPAVTACSQVVPVPVLAV
jgi:hypothetical protein